VLRSAEHEQEIMAGVVRERTAAAAAAIDRELSLLRARLFVLAGSTHLQTGDLAAFQAQASTSDDEDRPKITLSDRSGQELVNTRVSFGETLPVTADLDAIGRVVATGLPDISDFTRDPLTGEPLIAINVPVFRDARLAYVLS